MKIHEKVEHVWDLKILHHLKYNLVLREFSILGSHCTHLSVLQTGDLWVFALCPAHHCSMDSCDCGPPTPWCTCHKTDDHTMSSPQTAWYSGRWNTGNTPPAHQPVHTQVQVQCYFTSTETIMTPRDGEPRTATSTFTQFLSSHTHTHTQQRGDH